MKYYLLKFLSYFNIGLIRFHQPERLINFLDSIKIYDCGYDLIRYGEKNDGGYLVPDIMDQIKYLFSAGVGITTKFEDDIASKHNTKNYFIDFSVDLDLKKYHFTKKKVSYFNDDKNTTLENWINSCLKAEADIDSTNLMLSLDIESYEIESFLTMSDSLLKKFKVIVVEFHDFGGLKNEVGLKIYEIIFEKLKKYFHICHIHPVNNCYKYNFKGKVIPNVMEFTFINKLSAKHNKKISYDMPHKNDSISNTSYKEIVLPSYFYK
jgi:hypothetical protein